MNYLKFNSIKGSLNVITGCGSGLGLATLQRFIKSGSGPILGIDRFFPPDYEKDLGSTDELKDRLLLKTHDTFDEAKTEASLSEFVSKYGRIDNVINVAGVALAFLIYSKNSKLTYDCNHARNLLNFNTVGTFNVIRLASKHMIEDSPTKEGRTKCIINTSCISTSAPSIGQTFYAGSKSALDSMTLCIARELSQFNIRCNTINVGYFKTKLLEGSDEKIVDYIASKVALCPKKNGHPDEFAHLVQAMIENQMFNGCCVKIDAGAKELF